MSEYRYDEVSRIYDLVRDADRRPLELMGARAGLGPASRVLDLGCGTGSHALLLRAMYGSRITGVEPSAGMREKAREKAGALAPEAEWLPGSAASIPAGDGAFDLVYMTDVVHHVPDLKAMFAEAARVLAPGGLFAIASQSHAQIAVRPVARFFPETVQADRARYPSSERLEAAAAPAGLAFLGDEAYGEGEPVLVDGSFLELAERKGYSVLAAISEESYARGLASLRAALAKAARAGQPLWLPAAGGTVHWFGKGGRPL